MPRKPLIATIITCTALTLTPGAHADDTKEHGFFGLSIGYYDVMDDQDGIDIRAEYMASSDVFTANLKPWAGLEVTSQGSLWGGGGLAYDWGFAKAWHFTPSLGLGLYTPGGSDVDLDYPLQFRSQLKLSRELDNEARIGLALSHMSNAGLGDSNPGTEVLSLSYEIPLN